VVLNYVCIINFGYMAAAYTTAFSYIVLLLVQGILEYKVTGQVIVPLHKTLLIAVIYGVINIVSMRLFYVPWFIRYLILAAVSAAAFFIMRPQLTGVLKTFKKKK